MGIPLLQKLKNTGLRTRLLHPVDEYWDRRLGISTFGFVPAISDEEEPDLQMHYEPTPYRAIFQIIKHLDIGPNDSVVDFGSGPGRFIFAANWAGCGKNIGIEIDRSLHERALDNFRRSKMPPGRVELACMPAQKFDPSDVTRIYMFHPFGRRTLISVMENLRQSLKSSPRRIRLAYNNPVHADVIDAVGPLRMTDSWERDNGLLPYGVAFWDTAAVPK